MELNEIKPPYHKHQRYCSVCTIRANFCSPSHTYHRNHARWYVCDVVCNEYKVEEHRCAKQAPASCLQRERGRGEAHRERRCMQRTTA